MIGSVFHDGFADVSFAELVRGHAAIGTAPRHLQPLRQPPQLQFVHVGMAEKDIVAEVRGLRHDRRLCKGKGWMSIRLGGGCQPC